MFFWPQFFAKRQKKQIEEASMAKEINNIFILTSP